MIRTILKANSQTISISVPEHYVGKTLEVIAFTKDEGEYKKDASKKRAAFTVLHTDVKDFKFNRDEANER